MAKMTKAEQEQRKAEIEKIIVTTGDLKQEYEIINPIMVETNSIGYFDSYDFSCLISDVKEACYEVGGNAVICFRIYEKKHPEERNQTISVLYGTAVKFIKQSL